MANERLYQFPSKSSPVPADLIYAGDSANGFDEVNITIAQLISAYPNLSGLAGLTLASNTFPYVNNSAVFAAGSITALAISLLADSTTSTMQATLGYTATPSVSLFAGWDANKNLSANSFLSGYATTATAGATTTLLVGSAYQQYFTGSSTQTVLLPVTSTLALGQSFYIVNNSSGAVTVQSSGGNTIQAMAANTTLLVTCILTSGTTAASWNSSYVISSALTLPLSLANGGTGASLTAVTNGLVYSGASALAILATANNGVLITSAGGVPSISSTLPAVVQGNITALGTQAQALNMGSFQINNLATPSISTDAANKGYVDTVAAGFNVINGVLAASTTALTVTYSNGSSGVGATLTNAGAQAAFAIDGYTASLNDRILIKNQASSLQNGIYTVTTIGSGSTNWVLTRATDYNTAAAINPGDLIAIQNGTVNAGATYVETATVVTIGTDAISFTVFFSPASYLKVANNLSDVGSAATARSNLGLANAFITMNVQRITATGAFSYTATSGTKAAIFELQGGGGGSGGTTGTASQSCMSGGGSAGAYLSVLVTGSANLAAITGSVGAAGTAGASGNNAGGNGGSTTLTVNSGTQWVAAGGFGGGGQTSSAAAQLSGTSATTGGTVTVGTNGTLQQSIVGGGSITGFSNGVVQTILGYALGGNAHLGSGGMAVNTATPNYGGGAIGFYNITGANAAGLAGGQGVVIVTEFISN